jgi:hypothetical protein
MNLDDRFKVFLDPEAAPSTISTLLPVRIVPLFKCSSFLKLFQFRKQPPYVVVDFLSSLWMVFIDLHMIFIYNPDAPHFLQYAKGHLLRETPLDVLHGWNIPPYVHCS